MGCGTATLRRLRVEQPPELRWVFMSERGAPITERTAAHIIARAGNEAGLGLNVNPYMHAPCGGASLRIGGRIPG